VRADKARKDKEGFNKKCQFNQWLFKKDNPVYTALSEQLLKNL
jgi:hypothetical protein